MTIFNIHVEETDQTFPIPADIGAKDDLIKRALAGVIPYIDTAKLTREEKDGVTTINVIKSHAPKGAGVFRLLSFGYLESGKLSQRGYQSCCVPLPATGQRWDKAGNPQAGSAPCLIFGDR